MMKRTDRWNGFFLRLGNQSDINGTYPYRQLNIDIGGSSEKFSSIFVDENKKTYITYTYDPSKENENGVLYINGVKTETTNLGNIQNLINTPENTSIQIGSDIYETYKPEGDSSNRKYPFYGEIYASRVYNRPLTESEVKYNYEATAKNK